MKKRERINTKIEKFVSLFLLGQDRNTCWLWPGSKDRDGYGQVRISGKLKICHRLSWEINCGEIPKGKHVLHRCDIPACINPKHLFIGTHADNMRDCAAKGRNVPQFMYGEDNPMTKLTWEKVQSLRDQYKNGATERFLSDSFGISATTTNNIIREKTWKIQKKI